MAMATTFHGPKPWREICAALKTSGPRLAAVAFLGVDAPKLLSSFEADDIVVCNADESTLKSHATSVNALEALHKRGIILFNAPRLHAKVLVTDKLAVVGSANASMNSQACDEAVMITDQRSLVTSVRAFIDDLIATSEFEIDDAFLARARKIAGDGPPRGTPKIAGVTGKPQGESRFFMSPRTRLFLDYTEFFEYPDAVKGLAKEELRSVRVHVPPAAICRLEPWLLKGGDCPYKRGDAIVLVQQTGSRVTVYPPAVVMDVIPVPRRKTQNLVILKYRSQDKNLTRKKLMKVFDDAGITGFSVEEEHYGKRVQEKYVQTLLGAWGLTLDS